MRAASSSDEELKGPEGRAAKRLRFWVESGPEEVVERPGDAWKMARETAAERCR